VNPSHTLLGRVRRLRAADETLLERAARGDARSFEEIYRRHHDAVLGFCLLRMRDRHAAEDVTQEVFAKAADAACEGVEDVKAWLFTIARNAVIDARRRATARPSPSPLLEEDIERIAGPEDLAAMSALDVPANVFVALRRLKSRERNALIMREFQDRSSREIAGELGMTVGAVDVLLSRARGAFAVAYREVTEMPLACRQATELIYREMGSGLSDVRKATMDAHIAHCPRCAMEHRRAHSSKMLSALLGWPWLAQTIRAVEHMRLAELSLPAKAALGAGVVAVAITPAIGGAPAVRIDTAQSTLPQPVVARLEATVDTGDPPSEMPGSDDGMAFHREANDTNIDLHLEPRGSHREPMIKGEHALQENDHRPAGSMVGDGSVLTPDCDDTVTTAVTPDHTDSATCDAETLPAEEPEHR